MARLNWTHTKEHLDKIRAKSTKRCKELAKQREEEYLKNPKRCLHCGGVIPYKSHKRKSFCSSSCAASYNNSKRAIKPQPKFCKYCGLEIPKTGHESVANYLSKEFCSGTCKSKYAQEKYIQLWKEGKITGMSGEYPSERVRKYMLEKVGYKCSNCGWHEVNPFTGKIPLELHHIDGNPYNTIEDNLQVLCPNCHSLTRGYKTKHSEGRIKRRNQYSDKEVL